jgi:hypothetical protein
MNDLDLIATLAPDTPLANADDLARARERLTAEAAERGAGVATHGVGAHARPLRLAVAGVAVAAAAAGVAIALALSSGLPARPSATNNSQPSVSRSTGGTNAGSTHAALPATLTAAQFLRRGAAALRDQVGVLPRPDQYIYAETEGPHGSSKYQIWQSADGARPGLVEPAGGLAIPWAGGTTRPELIEPARRIVAIPLSPCTVAHAEAGRCSLAAGYLPQMPTSRSALFAFLVKIGDATAGPSPKPIPNWATNNLAKSVVSLLQDEYLSPAQQASLFELMAHASGIRLVRHAVDALGRSGVGVTWSYQGTTNELVLDPSTYAYLGYGTVSHGRSQPYEALVTKKIVDKLPRYHAPPKPSSAMAICMKVPRLTKAECLRLIARQGGTAATNGH